MSFERLQMLCEISDHSKGYMEFVHEWGPNATPFA
jgi:hypothetical protein